MAGGWRRIGGSHHDPASSCILYLLYKNMSQCKEEDAAIGLNIV
jgi:hypothetical protein